MRFDKIYHQYHDGGRGRIKKNIDKYYEFEGQCGVRALALATKQGYKKVYDDLVRISRNHMDNYDDEDLESFQKRHSCPYNLEALEEFLSENGFQPVFLNSGGMYGPNYDDKMTLLDVANKYGCNDIVVFGVVDHESGHAVCLKTINKKCCVLDGDDSSESFTTINQVWKKYY